MVRRRRLATRYANRTVAGRAARGGAGRRGRAGETGRAGTTARRRAGCCGGGGPAERSTRCDLGTQDRRARTQRARHGSLGDGRRAALGIPQRRDRRRATNHRARRSTPPATGSGVELERRASIFPSANLDVADATVIVVDDGLATGSTMLAAVAAVRALGPAAVVVAVPVGARQAVQALRTVADLVVCLSTPEPFIAVGAAYEDFRQLSDEEVVAILNRVLLLSPALCSATSASVPLVSSEEFAVGQRKDSVRNAASGPQLVELSQRAIDDRPNEVSDDRRERLLRSAGRCVRVRTPADARRSSTPSCFADLDHVDSMRTTGHDQQRLTRRSVAKINELAMAPTGHPRYCSRSTRGADRLVEHADSTRQPGGLQDAR